MFLVGSGRIRSFGIHRQLPKKWTQRYSEEVPEIDETNLFVVEEPREHWVTIQYVSFFFPGERILQGAVGVGISGFFPVLLFGISKL